MTRRERSMTEILFSYKLISIGRVSRTEGSSACVPATPSTYKAGGGWSLWPAFPFLRPVRTALSPTQGRGGEKGSLCLFGGAINKAPIRRNHPLHVFNQTGSSHKPLLGTRPQRTFAEPRRETDTHRPNGLRIQRRFFCLRREQTLVGDSPRHSTEIQVPSIRANRESNGGVSELSSGRESYRGNTSVITSRDTHLLYCASRYFGENGTSWYLCGNCAKVYFC